MALDLWHILPLCCESKWTLSQRAKCTKLLEDQRQPVPNARSCQEHRVFIHQQGPRGHSLFPYLGDFQLADINVKLGLFQNQSSFSVFSLLKGSLYFSLIYLYIFGCAGCLLLHWLLCSCRALASRCGDFSCCRAQALGMRASIVVELGLSGCSAACRIFPDQRSNPCPLRWQVDS